ncbi:MAG: TonB-dependent receptor plug domain-containing protein [Burkholderiaceae bacterium]
MLPLLVAAPIANAQEADTGAGGADRPSVRAPRVEVIAKPQSDADLRRQSSVAKQIYGREELDRFGDTNVLDVLKRLPGVSVQGGAPRMRGLGSGYTLILLNGEPAPPGFQYDQLDPAQIERIEISRAPTADQSAQAVAGSINIILKQAPRSLQRQLRAGLSYRAVRPTVGFSYAQGERIGDWSYNLPISFFQWRGLNRTLLERGLIEEPSLDQLGVGASSLQQGSQQVWGHGVNLSPQLRWRPGSEQEFSAQGFFQRGQWNNSLAYLNQPVLAGKPDGMGLGAASGSPLAAYLEPDQRFAGGWTNANAQLRWERRLGDDRKLELRASARQSEGDFDGSNSYGRRALGGNKDRNLTQGARLAFGLGEAHAASLGWDLEWRERHEFRTVTVNGLPQLLDFEGFPFDARISRQALFVQDEWEIDSQWTTYIGMRHERISLRAEGVGLGQGSTSSVTTPVWHVQRKLDSKGKDMLRLSLSRSYKAPEPWQIIPRPTVSNLFSDLNRANIETSPDRVGNPSLRPELASGLDLALERYLPSGGVISVGGFYRRVDQLVRNLTRLRTVDWSPVPRFVSMPENIAQANSYGLELEVKGAVGELLPGIANPRLPIQLRAALNYYRSDVRGIPGPDNRLDGQQPWSALFGMDHRLAGLPLSYGFQYTVNPAYRTTQSALQFSQTGRVTSFDAYGLWRIDRASSFRSCWSASSRRS